MPANTQPIYTRLGDVQWINVVTANTSKDLTSGTSYLVWTADSTNGGFLQKLRIRPAGTNVATVLRIWINNGSTTGTAANNTLYDEITVPATTNSETAAIAGTEIPMNMALPASFRVYITTGTSVTSIFVTGVGGKY